MSEEQRADGWREAARRNAEGWVEAERREAILRSEAEALIRAFDKASKDDPVSSLTYAVAMLAEAAGFSWGGRS